MRKKKKEKKAMSRRGIY